MLDVNVILVEPLNPGNLGAIARVMKNFGCSRLILIRPGIDPSCPESRVRAKHALDVLENAEIRSKLDDLGQLDFLIGTSAHVGGDYNPLRVGITVEEMVKNLQGLDGQIGLVFGREGSGLTNEELNMCNFLVSIPSSPSYKTLNLSHAACILLYEIYKLKQAGKEDPTLFRKADKMELNQLSNKFQAILDYLHEKMKKFSVRRRIDAARVFQNIIGRAFVSGREAHTMMGVFRHVLENLQGEWDDRD